MTLRVSLAVIDLQQVFADPTSPWAAPGFSQIIGPVTRLVEAFGDRTVFTRFVAPGTPQGSWTEYYEQWPFARQSPDAPLYALVDPFAGRPTVDEPTFGKWTPAVRAALGDPGVLILAGVATDCCVISTALAAADAGVAVKIAADGCAGADDGAQQRALELMASYAPLIEVLSTEDIITHFSAAVPRTGRAGRALG